jgi:hypothetical protein
MSKKEEKKQKPSRQQASFPSAPTLFRVVGLSNTFEQTLAGVFRSSATQLGRDELLAAERIRQAQTLAQVVALSGQTPGVAQIAWIRRMNEFGVEALPAIARRLKSAQSIVDKDEQHIAVERMIGALRRLGPPGGLALLECFNNLDDYCQSLSSVTLGVMGVAPASEVIWRYYQRVKKQAGESHVIGALWGLINLHHPQVDEAVAELLNSGQPYAEAYPFAALAGGTLCVRPLAFRLGDALGDKELYDGERDDILMALAGIGQRLGPDAFAAALREISDDEELVKAIAGLPEARTPEDVAQYFQMYFKNPDEMLAGPSEVSDAS